MRLPRTVVVLLVAGLGLLVLAQEPPGWVAIDYAPLLDRRALTHSGEPLGVVLDRLRGAGPGEPAAAAALALAQPLLEPWALVLPDVADAGAGAVSAPLVEVGWLWEEGAAQPGWVELLRSRQLVLESDGAGFLRAFVPARSTSAPAAAAWEEAWPVLRLALAAERRRLGRPLQVRVHRFVHEPTRTRFLLAPDVQALEIDDVEAHGRTPLERSAWAGFLARGLRLEGARLEPGGLVRLVGSEAAVRPSILDEPVSMADLATAYRAVFHGGLAEPYMSLDRGETPWMASVSYGGRLRDTRLGLVSLLCDVRFKTFSLGIDLERALDRREEIRRAVPGFLTHLERFARDPASRGTLSQQTRLWFYPDDVELVVSEAGDVLVIGRPRMTAASERLAGAGAAAGDPPWTRDTVTAINAQYARLASIFPELADLDEVVRLLALFTWLRQAASEGAVLPDLDALLDVELPEAATPREYPHLLAFTAVPPPSPQAAVAVLERSDVVAALERLRTIGGALPAGLRLERARAVLDPRAPDQAALLEELRRADPDRLDEGAIDLLASRAERLTMHALVLATLSREQRTRALETIGGGTEGVRAFSVAIGGLDLGMGEAVARARRGGLRLGAERSRAPAARPQGQPWEPARRTAVAAAAEAPERGGRGRKGASPPPAAAGPVLPPHGVGADTPDRWVRRSGEVDEVVAGASSPEPRSRRLMRSASGTTVERWERGRLLRYSVILTDGIATLRPEPPRVAPVSTPLAAAAPLPAGLALLAVEPSPAGSVGLSPQVSLRLTGREADLETEVGRGALRRLLLGPGLEPGEGSALPGVFPPPASLGTVRSLMLLASPELVGAPWPAPRPLVVAEEDPRRLAEALVAWRAARGGSAIPAVVGVDRDRSPARWSAAPGLRRATALGFGALEPAVRDALSPLLIESDLPARRAGDLVVVVSAEPPGLLGARLRELSRRGEMEGRLLAIVPLAGPLRADLPAALLAQGRLAGVGVAPWVPAGTARTLGELSGWAAALAGPGPRDRRVEDLPGPFVWWF